MLRKVIQLGSETLVVSLPSAWARQHRLRKGDELEAEEQGPKLVFYPKAEQKPGKAVIDVSGTHPVTKRIIAALYKAGYDEVDIVFESPEELEIAEHTVREEFVGFEIVSKTKRMIQARSISESRHDEFNTLIRRVFLLLLEMGSECFKAINSGSYAALEAIAGMDEDINRHVNFCRRSLNTIGHRIVGRVAPSYHMVEQLERAGDCYKHLCAYIARVRFAPSSALKELLAEANSFLRMFYELYHKFSLADITQFWKEKERLEGVVSEAFEVAGKKEMPAMFLISELINNVAGANGALLTARL